MAGPRKYLSLPDLDHDPEVYQTTVDAETATTVQGDSEPSEGTSSEDSDEESSGIQRSRLNPRSARSQFTTSRVDASKANFSDQVGRHRRSYYVSRGYSDEDEDELDPEKRLKRHNLSKRISRMQQLLEDLKNDVAVAKENGEWKENSQEDDDKNDDAALVKMSESVNQLTVTDRGADSATTRMKRRSMTRRSESFPKLRSDESGSMVTKSVESRNYSQISDPQALAVYTKFSSRLDTLENLLGLDSMPPPDLPSVKDFPMPIIKMTDVMARQINLMGDADEAFLDQMAKKIQTVTTSIERMEGKRKEAQKSYEELIAARDSSTTGFSSSNGYPITPRSPTLSGTTRMPGGEGDGRSPKVDPDHPLIDPELPAKISALYTTLPAIENLAPMLHPTLERLRALREVHQDSASAHTRLNELEQHEAEIQRQLKQWKETLGQMEQTTTELEEEWLENMQNVEKKVNNLESRIKAL